MTMSRFILLGALLFATPAHAQVYTRFELGYSRSFDADFRDQDFNRDGLICGNGPCSTPGAFKDVGNSPVFGAAIGTRYTEHVRADLSLTYRPGYKLDKTDAGSPPAQFKADVKSLAFMANGYWDFPLEGWAPYLGLGLGVSSNTVGSMSGNDGATFTVSTSSKTTTSGAWAFMAGLGVPFSSVTVDFGYRFIDLGRIETGSGQFSFMGVSGPYSGASGRLKGHELTLGFRF